MPATGNSMSLPDLATCTPPPLWLTAALVGVVAVVVLGYWLLLGRRPLVMAAQRARSLHQQLPHQPAVRLMGPVAVVAERVHWTREIGEWRSGLLPTVAGLSAIASHLARLVGEQSGLRHQFDQNFIAP